MQINIKKSGDVAAGFDEDVELKFAPLAKFIKNFDATGEAEIWIELSRTTKKHDKAEMFKVAADLRLPKKILRAEAYAKDIRTAIDEARNLLRSEIEKYKTQFVKLDKKKLAK